jgi:predicted CoA-binding protein
VGMNLNKESLKAILKNISSIALIGASPNPQRDSYKVMKFLISKGYEVFPVNPNHADNKILGKKCFSNLKEINQKIDMVDIFRSKEFVMEITQDAIKKGVEVIWTQEGIVDEKSSRLAKDSDIIFVMNECPKKVLEN